MESVSGSSSVKTEPAGTDERRLFPAPPDHAFYEIEAHAPAGTPRQRALGREAERNENPEFSLSSPRGNIPGKRWRPVDHLVTDESERSRVSIG